MSPSPPALRGGGVRGEGERAWRGGRVVPLPPSPPPPPAPLPRQAGGEGRKPAHLAPCDAPYGTFDLAMTETYHLEELDRETRDYLAHARERLGRGLPGLYVGQTDAMPLLGIVLGFAVIIATVLMTMPPTAPPAKEAMLQTAGLMLGGWLILAAFRAWAAARSGRYA